MKDLDEFTDQFLKLLEEWAATGFNEEGETDQFSQWLRENLLDDFHIISEAFNELAVEITEYFADLTEKYSQIDESHKGTMDEINGLLVGYNQRVQDLHIQKTILLNFIELSKNN